MKNIKFCFLIFILPKNIMPRFNDKGIIFMVFNKAVLVYQVKKLLMEGILALFLHIILYKSGFLLTRRIIEACRTSRALGYTRSVVLFSRRSEFAAKKTLSFLFRCVLSEK